MLIPTLSWGNTERHYCYPYSSLNKESGNESKLPTSTRENPYIYFYELNHKNETFATYYNPSEKLMKEYWGPDYPYGMNAPISYIKNGTSYSAKNSKTEYAINPGQVGTMIVKYRKYDQTWNCISDAEYSRINIEKDPIDIVNQCLDLVFKKGTESLKNCVLELN